MWYNSKLFRAFTCKEFWFVLMIFDSLTVILSFYEGSIKTGIWMSVMTAMAIFFYNVSKPYSSMPATSKEK